MLSRVRQVAEADVSTAVAELHAGPTQAKLVSLHAFAWRADVVLLPGALLAALILIAVDKAWAGAAAGIAFAIVIAPQVIALLISMFVGFIPDLRTLFRGSHEQRVRFAIGGANAYIYYGWRYAFRGRRRPWGALTQDEKVAINPMRAGAAGRPPQRRNYWPE